MSQTAVQPQPAGDLVSAAQAELSRGNYRQALEAFDQVLRSDPSSLAAWLGRGNAQNFLGDLGSARQAYEGVITRQSNLANVRAWIGDLAIAQGDYAAAFQWLQQELQVNPRSAWAYSVLGTLYLHLNRQAEADQAMQAARALDANIASQRYSFGQILGSAAAQSFNATVQDMRAAWEFKSVLTLDPGNLAALYGLGLHLARLGDVAQATSTFQTYLSRDQSSEWAQRARQILAQLSGGTAAPANPPVPVTQPAPPQATIPSGGPVSGVQTGSSPTSTSSGDSGDEGLVAGFATPRLGYFCTMCRTFPRGLSLSHCAILPMFLSLATARHPAVQFTARLPQPRMSNLRLGP